MNRIEMNPCAVVPVYNHGRTARGVVETLKSYHLPVIIIDDASGEETRLILEGIVKDIPQCQLFRLERNQGKGGAVMKGLIEAKNAGYTHALQVDSDGQHDLSMTGEYLQLGRENPNCLIAGYPLFDETVPLVRKVGRQLTKVMVYIETLSNDIVDAMCGFRLYPLGSTCRLINTVKLGKRMDFDIQVLVKLHWRGIPMRFLPIKVIYPEGGISHFRMLRDNVIISKMHIFLCLEMILRFPYLIYNNIFQGKKRVRN